MRCKNNCCSKKSNVIAVTSVILTGLFMLDVIYQGQVYKRLPTAWQNKLSDWIGR